MMETCGRPYLYISAVWYNRSSNPVNILVNLIGILYLNQQNSMRPYIHRLCF